jgi:hypothetical protein
MISPTVNLLDWITNGTDLSVVAEIYPADETPADDGFDPNNALKCYAKADGIEFMGVSYTRLIKSIGRIKRTIGEEINSASFELDNLSREASQFEFSQGFEGLIVVFRWISRSQSTSLEDSVILWTGRLNAPDSGSKTGLPLSAKFILGSVKQEIPRRKFSPDDLNGRPPQDILYEGFRFSPQYGTTTYSNRERRGGLAGMLGFKKTVKHTLQYSSFSDLDAEKSLPDAFGRVQLIGTHIGYADLGTFHLATTVFCEGEVQDLISIRADDTRFSNNGTIKRYGKLGGVGTQIPHTDPRFNNIANGYFSRTALLFTAWNGSNVQTIDPAPGVIAVVLSKIITIPDGSGDWVTSAWSDNGAAVVRHLIVNDDYFKIGADWVDDASFLEAYNYNNELIFDYSYSDLLFIPDSLNFFDSGDFKQNYFVSTGIANADYFKYLGGAKTSSETFLNSPYAQQYDTELPIEPIEPIEPGGTTGTLPSLAFFLRRRYTCNVAVSETQSLIDFMHEPVLLGSRMFLSQGANGRIKLNHKKPTDYAYATAGISAGASSVSADDVRAWIADPSKYLLIDPHTTVSEVRSVTGATYSTAQNSVTLSASANITVSGFSGCDGAETPGSATLTINTKLTTNSFTLDGVQTIFNAGAADTTQTIAGFIHGAINAHPSLRRKFFAEWTPGSSVVTITGKFGSIALSSNLENAHSAPITDPTAAPVLTATASGTFPAGIYKVCYTYSNERGQTLVSPLQSVTLSANQKITVTGITPPGSASVNWYVSPAQGSQLLRLHSTNDGTGFIIDTLPKLTDSIPPDFNRTGCEVMRVCAVFSDRAETRSDALRSNVLKASFKFRLGNRQKPINRVDLKYRDASQDFRLITLKLSDKAHIEKTKNVNNEEIDGQSIDNYHQAYRIASGILAEQRDADFFHEWKSDRIAGLLEEGDVVCITDDGAEVYNLPVRIEDIEIEEGKGLPVFNFVGRKYASTLYDDSVSERIIPVVIERGFIT